MKDKLRKGIAVFAIIIAVINMVLLGMQLISPITFWIVLGLVALIAFYLMPKLK